MTSEGSNKTEDNFVPLRRKKQERPGSAFYCRFYWQLTAVITGLTKMKMSLKTSLAHTSRYWQY